jgi:ADP-heptose:LPS heptosyltransferase
MGLKPWKGEPTHGKRLLLMHAHGHGDTIMALRFVPKDAILCVPESLRRIADQFGKVVSEPVDCDYVCPILHLLHHVDVVPGTVPSARYVDARRFEDDIKEWGDSIGPKMKKRIGVAWNVGKFSKDDYPREIELKLLVDHLTKREDVEIHSVQIQGEAEAEACGVIHHGFKDFTECAALMAHMNEIVSVDTAALHLAGAIGHPKVTGLLSSWSSWRWEAKWYRNVELIRQRSEGDWTSALEQRHG